MKMVLIIVGCVALALAASGTWAVVRFKSAQVPTSDESRQFDAEVRSRLVSLRQETKFQPHDFSPLGYTGPATPEDATTLNAAINDFIDSVLAKPDAPISARDVSAMMKRPIDRVNWLETEDRDRLYDYLVEVWYILGFRGATGHFGAGSAEWPAPDGYAERLPPGWTAPDQPRAVGGNT